MQGAQYDPNTNNNIAMLNKQKIVQMNQASILSHVSKGKKPPQAADGINQGQPGHYSYSQKLLAKRT
jgi:hypothetical protein